MATWVLFWALIVVALFISMASELFQKPMWKRVSRWIFVGAAFLAVYSCFYRW